MRILYTILLIGFFLRSSAQEMDLEIFAQGFSLPVDISHAGDNRLFITEKAGTIRVLLQDGSQLTTLFLDIRNKVSSAANERGLLGLSFHPDYKINGYFFVNYTNLSGHTTVSRFSVSGNPNVADPNSEKIIIVINQPFNNHNGGDLEFGPDGYLYIGLGDGGSGNDPGNRSQNPKELLGKMLRLNVDTDMPYEIPPDNPWINNPDTLPEIWAFGLRNPWRFSFDRLAGDLWIGDVGQSKWEEINFVKNGTPAINYGWRCYEGPEVTTFTQGCKDESFYTPPVFSYRNPTLGCSVTGGYVYRGSLASRYYGEYIFADFCSGRFWAVTPDTELPFQGREIGRFSGSQYVSFGEDLKGDLYVAAIGTGRIFKFIDPVCSYLDTINFIDVQQVSCFDTCDASIISQDIGTITSYLWNNSASVASMSDLCPGQYSLTVTDVNGCVKAYDFVIDSVEALTVQLTLQGSLMIATTNQTIQQYQWYKDGVQISGENGNTLQTSGNGNYFVVVTNENGCTAQSEDIQFLDCSLLETETTITITQATCHDSCDAVIQLENIAEDISYLWITGATGNMISDLCPGTYSVILTDSLDCEAVLEIVVDTVQELTIDVIITNQFFAAFANQNVTFQWYRNGELIDGATGSTFLAAEFGVYFVIVTNENGCTAQSEDIQFLDCSHLETETTITITPVTCHDSCDAIIQLENIAEDISYLWITGETGNMISGLCPGEYTVILRDTSGCEAFLEIVIDTVQELTIDVLIAGQFFEAFANQEVTFQWYRNGELIDGATGSTFEATGSGEYYVIVTNENGCTARSFSIIISSVSSSPEDKLKLTYYVSGSGEIVVSFNSDLTTSIGLSDVTGKILYRDNRSFFKNEGFKIPVFLKVPAMYIFFYDKNNEVVSHKILVKN